MKLTEARIKEIIKEEVDRMNEQEQQPQEEDDAKTLAELRKFMIEKSKQIANLKGAT